MANELINRKFFTIIHATLRDLAAIEPIALGICERCNAVSADGYIPTVLGHYWLCPKCFAEWYKTAVNYPDDVKFAHAVYREYVARFRAAGVWCDRSEYKEKKRQRT